MPDKPITPCDCLNWCGDDPWLQDGRAAYCEHALQRQARDRQLREDRHSLHTLIDQLSATAQARATLLVDASLVAELSRLVQALVRR